MGKMLIDTDGWGCGIIWLVWGLNKTRCDLIAIASTEQKANQYRDQPDKKYEKTMVERAPLDHTYGHRMLKAFNDGKHMRAAEG